MDDFNERARQLLSGQNVPFHRVPTQQGEISAIPVAGVVMTAGVIEASTGRHLPVIVFNFTNGVGPSVPPIALVLVEHEMRDLKGLIVSAVDAALQATREKNRGIG